MSSQVLVVDDDPGARALCRRILEREGYGVAEASDGLEALEQIGHTPPDIVIMDAVMPVLDGLECTRQLKASPITRDIPVIMVSARDDSEDIENSLAAGVDEYIVKPIRHREFVLRVRSMARLYRSKWDLIRSNEVRGEQARGLEILLDLSRSIVGAGDLDAIVERIVAAAAELTVSRRVSIMLPNREDDCLTIVKAIGMDEQVAASVRVPVGSAIAGQVFLSGQAAVINSPEEDTLPTDRYDSAFFASVPLISGALRATDRVVGVLNITERCGGRPFGETELEYVDLLCNMAGSAIDEFMTHRARDEARDSIVTALATLAEYRDVDTGRHLERVTRYAAILAEELRTSGPYRAQIDDGFISDLQRSMPLHDIGKVAVPDYILLKPGRLTPDETAIMKRHAQSGAEMIRSVIGRTPGVRFLEMAEQIAHGHHEWYDGTGYPRGLAGDDIPLPARIAALADVYDALTSERPYKHAMSYERAAQIIIASSQSQFDPAVVVAFVQRGTEFAELTVRLADDPTVSAGSAQPVAPLAIPAPGLHTGALEHLR